jgi:hypothetical protein
MTTAVLASPRFPPINSTAPSFRQQTQKIFISQKELDEHFASELEELINVISAPISVMSTDFAGTTTLSVSSHPLQSVQSKRVSVLHELRLFTGTALLGAVTSGLAFGWYTHRETMQWIGAGVAVLIFAFVHGRAKHDARH